MTPPVLETKGLSKSFVSGTERVDVFSGLDISLAPGQSLSLVGRSGSGKSTLLNIVCGLESADCGTVSILGQRFDTGDAESPRARERRWASLRRQRIGVVFQDANLMPALSLADNVRLRARLAGRSTTDSQDWLQRLGIGELANRYPDQVSGGQRQRAAMAMVFAMQPDLILADEPTGSLDRHTADEVADTLFALQADAGVSLVLATHDTELAGRCESILDMAHRNDPGPGG
jgi:putative ABC transport system ATP-binding protein